MKLLQSEGDATQKQIIQAIQEQERAIEIGQKYKQAWSIYRGLC
jgi:hypothetical protein